MQGKRALVVDDSKSARVVLSRMLEKYGIEVDSAESAETALEYLKDHHPDVIFMDHLMPGMDGLQAVREIKANPELASIPVMMYTSQEGEIYGGQARASGAIGVLPKSIRPIDVTKALYQLQLLPERRDYQPSALEAMNEDGTAVAEAMPVPAPAASSDSRVRAMVEAMLKEQSIELRRFIVSSFDSHAHRIVQELRPRESGLEDAAAAAVIPPPPARPMGWMIATGAALVALLAIGLLYWQAVTQTRQAERALESLTASNESLTQAIEKWRIAGDRPAAADGGGGGAAARPMVYAIPFGESALTPARLEPVRALVAQLERAAISGSVRIETYAGSFCLASAGEQGYALAPAATPASQCEQVGNPYEDPQGGAARQPLAFVNLAASVQQRTNGAITLELAPGARERIAVSYPAIEQATAGQWNAAAQSNNRIEISVVER